MRKEVSRHVRGLEVITAGAISGTLVSRHVRGLEDYPHLRRWRHSVSRHVRGLEVPGVACYLRSLVSRHVCGSKEFHHTPFNRKRVSCHVRPNMTITHTAISSRSRSLNRGVSLPSDGDAIRESGEWGKSPHPFLCKRSIKYRSQRMAPPSSDQVQLATIPRQKYIDVTDGFRLRQVRQHAA